jgi:CHASE3 domain sensor protein
MVTAAAMRLRGIRWPVAERRSDLPPAFSRRRSLRLWLSITASLLVLATLIAATGNFLERHRVDSAQARLRQHLRPAAASAQELTTAYVNQETGQRGFLLTGDTAFLEPYSGGTGAVSEIQNQLKQLLAGNSVALSRLGQAVAAGDAWHIEAEQQIAARRQNSLPPQQVLARELTSKRLFDTLRSRLADLTGELNRQITTELAVFDDAQADANSYVLAALLLAVLGSITIVLLVWQLITRPLSHFLSQVQAVADGAYDQEIDRRGPQEVSIMAEAVEKMRANMMRSSRQLMAANEELSARAERDRMAADLHDLTIQRVFRLGLSLSSFAAREPRVAARVEPLVAETDHIIRELRGVIFALGENRDAYARKPVPPGTAEQPGTDVGRDE